jgi:hypothetical protein
MSNHPYARDLDGAWHQRPKGDAWQPQPADTQCSTLCGRRIASDQVSAIHPLQMKKRPAREWACGGCFR